MNFKYFLLVCFALVFCSNVQAQQLDHRLGQVIIQFHPTTDVSDFTRNLQTFKSTQTALNAGKVVISDMNIHVFHFDHNRINEQDFKKYLADHPAVKVVQFNHLIQLRNTPNDPQFPQQWQYINDGANGGVVGADIDADLAWDFTTGGLTTDGDTIVVCAIDDGIDSDHEDFEDNLWFNYAEIPDNGIDDDGNGYVDDYRGWNSNSDSDNIEGGGHGTPVAGIMGAKGNNNIGVAGMSWNVKVMVVKNDFNTDEANVLKAYGYPYTARKRYNETNGAEGAFVVSTNASWGIDQGDPADAPLWCSFYDSLGVHGILNCGATANANFNIDETGDLPTACPSDFMISVTNMNRTDTKENGAGFGIETIDLGAFGAQTWTTASNNGYGPFGGTSGATPHVTGAIGLLYAAPCPNLMTLAKANPSAAALLVRQYILEGTDPNESLEGITVTGGRLNINNSMLLLMNECGGCIPPLNLSSELTTSSTADLTWIAADSSLSSNLRWRTLGDTLWTTIMDAPNPLTLMDLAPCSDYEFQVMSICADTMSNFSNSHVFSTEIIVDNFNAIPSENKIDLSWTVPSVNIGNLTFHINAINMDTINTSALVNDGMLSIDNLESCTIYEINVYNDCDTLLSNPIYSNIVQTSGCGPCIDLPYCESRGLDASEEWIANVSLANVNNSSESDDGYALYAVPAIELARNSQYPLSLSPGYGYVDYDEYFKVWIDFNADGDFDDDNEAVFDPEAFATSTLETVIFIPADAALGSTRMRVSMRYNNEPEVCDTSFEFGEVEDYCVTIIENTIPCDPVSMVDTTLVDTTIANIAWAETMADTYQLRFREFDTEDWVTINNINITSHTLINLMPSTTYEVQVRSICGTSFSDFSASLIFETDAIPTNTTNIPLLNNWTIAPNPVHEVAILQLNLKATENLQIEVIDVNGRLVYQLPFQSFTAGTHSLEIASLDWQVGVYFVQLQSDNSILSRRLIKL